MTHRWGDQVQLKHSRQTLGETQRGNVGEGEKKPERLRPYERRMTAELASRCHFQTWIASYTAICALKIPNVSKDEIMSSQYMPVIMDRKFVKRVRV